MTTPATSEPTHRSSLPLGSPPNLPEAPPRRQPAGLYVLFFTEMWERFSFYGMRALLVLYMTKHLMFSQPRSSVVYGWYTGLVYLTPFLGGRLADRRIGYKRAIVSGGLLMMVGHFLMAVDRLPFFFAALGLICLGNGLFKPIISTLVGKLYETGDPRRDRGFTIFYIGINIGACLSPLVCGGLASAYGDHVGFAAAGVGMLIGVSIFLAGQRWLRSIDMGLPKSSGPAVVDATAPNENPATEKGRITALIIIFLFVIFFWAAYEQTGNTLTLWADANTVRSVNLPFKGAWEIPPSWFQSVNPAFIFLLAPIFSLIWGLLGRRGREPSTGAKMALGLFFLGLSFVVMVAAAAAAGSDQGQVSAWWLIGSYSLATAGELCLSPIGLSLVTKVAPSRLGGMLMGLWFMANAVGAKLAGMVGELWTRYPHATFFEFFVASSVAAAVLLFALLRPLKRLMAGAA